ncbi:MAG: hypothetical protein Sylvanvirus1_58 [Sylvanvirus sp.]|uniref:Uncharacterized protein n=1 Tax=Sylvanvirus sp. TaxID=2487774 RepID=A0A3G5AGY6_9VIRU|nr:MAG: hypothetical protein Sylvanvirus1_58 [Sylvanvirus sp.]
MSNVLPVYEVPRRPPIAHRPYRKRPQYGQATLEQQQANIVPGITDVNQLHPALSAPWTPQNKRDYARLTTATDTNCEVPTTSLFTQFQLYCTTQKDDADNMLRQMQWPIPVRFFDNFKIPGYAIIFNQASPNKRYEGEAYWIGWELPGWMSLPSFLLTDDQKRKLSIFWIAKQRRNENIRLMQYRKLSILLCTYYPDAKQLRQRVYDNSARYTADVDGWNARAPNEPSIPPPIPEDYEIYTFQNVNFKRFVPVHQVLENPRTRNRLVYMINGGKGASIAKNKTISLSYILSNPSSTQIPFDSWITNSFPFRVNNNGQVSEVKTWANTYNEFGDNDDEVLDAFINTYTPVIEQLIYGYELSVREFIEQDDPRMIARMFYPYDRESGMSNTQYQDELTRLMNEEPFKRNLQQWMDRRAQLLQTSTPAQLAQLEADSLIRQLNSGVPEELERYNSSATLIRNKRNS